MPDFFATFCAKEVTRKGISKTMDAFNVATLRQFAPWWRGMSAFFSDLVASFPGVAHSSAFVATGKAFPVTENGHLLTRKLYSATWIASLVATFGLGW